MHPKACENINHDGVDCTRVAGDYQYPGRHPSKSGMAII